MALIFLLASVYFKLRLNSSPDSQFYSDWKKTAGSRCTGIAVPSTKSNIDIIPHILLGTTCCTTNLPATATTCSPTTTTIPCFTIPTPTSTTTTTVCSYTTTTSTSTSSKINCSTSTTTSILIKISWRSKRKPTWRLRCKLYSLTIQLRLWEFGSGL